MPEVRYFDTPPQLEVRTEGSKRIVSGYGIVFNKLSRTLGGWFKERIDPGAVSEELLRRDVLALFNHDMNYVLARTASKTLTLEVDETGVKYRFEAPDTTAGNDLIVMLERGDISHSSFSFYTGEARWEEDEEGNDVRVVTNISSIIDMGPVTNAAYLDTTAGMDGVKRSYDEWKQERMEKEEVYDDMPDYELELELLKLNH